MELPLTGTLSAFGQEDAALYQYLGTLLRHCVMIAAAGDRTEEFHG